MARDIFAEDFEDKTEGTSMSFDTLSKKIGSTVIEKAGLITAVFILLVVAVVMTSDISFISISDVKDFSVEAFLLLFLCNSMYGNMYHTGSLAAKKLEKYKKIKVDYAVIRDEVKEHGFMKRLTAFCKEYVDNELKARRENLLEYADVSWEEYLKCRHLSKRELKAMGLTKVKVKAICDANWIVPIKLEPSMIYTDGGRNLSRNPMHLAPSTKRIIDFSLNFLKTGATSLGMCFIGFQLLADPSWQTMCAVAAKMLTVILNGYSGYRHGYDSVAVTEFNFVSDQIDILEQYKVWKGSEEVFSTIADVPAIEGSKN